MYQCDLARMDEKIRCFSQFGATGHGGITRFSLSPAALEARAEFKKRCESLGMTVVSDDMANLYATLPGSEDLPAIAMGSHLDSVRQGGNYDGVLGVLTALEAAETVVRNHIPHRHPLKVLVWTNEEGARFEPAMMSSGVITGKFSKAAMLASKDKEGQTFGEALEASGYQGDEANRFDPQKNTALFELHIEQGPVLEAEKLKIGVVEGVCGMINYEFTFRGQADHAGTTPMSYRKDALYAAALFLIKLHEELDKLDSKLVYTTGKISCHPDIHTIIPDEVKITLDARHQDPAVIDQVIAVINHLPRTFAGCSWSYEEAWARKTVQFSPQLVDLVEASTKALGYPFKRMYSGPGHDAQYLADLVPTAMIFVPSVDGHSHCEEEYTPTADCLNGANVLLNAVLMRDQEEA